MNLEVEILKTIHRNPRVTPVLIHSMLKNKTYFEEVERILKFMRGLELVETKYRGILPVSFILTSETHFGLSPVFIGTLKEFDGIDEFFY